MSQFPDFRLEDVSKSYGCVDVFDGVSGTVSGGRTTGIVGPNGAGKTTLLALLTGFDQPDQGAVYYGERRIDELSLTEVAMLGIRRKFQDPALFDNLTTYENVQVALCSCATSPVRSFLGRCTITDAMDAEILATLDRFRLAGSEETLARSLSGGERQLLSFARATVGQCECLVLDEPISGVNPGLHDRLVDHIERLAADHTIVIVEHNVTFLERVADEILLVRDGDIEQRDGGDRFQSV
jgi:ABC-type branched-subunit amino acid transport system ATPase component